MSLRSGRNGRALIACGLFLLLALIALYVRDDIIRPFGGDILVVIFLYFALRSVTNWPRAVSALIVLGFAVIIEVSQGLGLVERLNLDGNPLASVILGATFDPMDLLAYSIGAALAFLADRT
ncbi:DUF2809 domain-containing protein [Parvularcula marina]|uniref:ribosomal maturation YjgA family protein n=1 Tax=Parvularcula marina TaxID=2292771 RepID=UPI0035175925